MIRLSKKSKARLDTCHPHLKAIVQIALVHSKVDFAIIEGYRSIEKQLEYFNDKKSQIDGIKVKGKHNVYPSRAFDFCPYYYRKQQWKDAVSFAYLAGMFMYIGSDLRQRGLIKCRIRWGGNWNNNGILRKDQNFDDMPHIEIIGNG